MYTNVCLRNSATQQDKKRTVQATNKTTKTRSGLANQPSNLLLQMGCQSPYEFVRTNVFYCHTTGHLIRKNTQSYLALHKWGARWRFHATKGPFLLNTRGSQEIRSAILPCWKRRERMRGAQRTTKGRHAFSRLPRSVASKILESWIPGKRIVPF